MTSPSSALPTSHLIDYATSLGRRLLSGTGTSSLVVYRDDGQRSVSMLCHGITEPGRFVLAGLIDELPEAADGGLDVRVDLTREAAVPDVRIVAASAHLQGWFAPMSDEQLSDAVAAGELPEHVRGIALAPGVVVGELRARRMLLHQGCGTVPLNVRHLLAQSDEIYPAAEDELAAFDVVASSVNLRELHADVITGRVPGRVLSSLPTAEGIHACGRVHLMDVDAHGVTLLRVGDVTTVVYIPFPEPIRDVTELSFQLAGLRIAS